VTFIAKEIPAQVGQPKESMQVSLKELRNAPNEIVLDGKSLSLSAYLWRDFTPSTSSSSDGSPGTPLMATLKVATSDKQPFPTGVRMDRAWVIFEEQIWVASDFRSQVKPSPEEDGWIICSAAPVCEATIRRGPKWGPGVFVDIVLRLTDKEGQYHLIQVQRQLIQRSD